MANEFTDVQAREQDFVSRFAQNWDALKQILGIMRPIKRESATELVSYTAEVKGGLKESPEAGQQIQYTDVKVTEARRGNVKIEKYAKAVTIEDVDKYGADVAIEKTDEAFLNELQTTVMDRFYTFLKTGTLTGKKKSFQMALAMAKGLVLDKFNKIHKTATEVVGFINVLDLYEYLGDTPITIQTMFGVQYVENFLGYKTLFLLSDPEIPQGTVIATPVENIDLYYVDPSNSDFAKLGLVYTTDGETNLIGFHANGNYGTAVGESFALMGMELWAEYIDGVSVITFDVTTEDTPSVSLDKSEATVAPEATTTITATTVPADATVTWTTSDATKATVANGVVTGVAEGTATITASITVDGTAYTATCAVTVTAGV